MQTLHELISASIKDLSIDSDFTIVTPRQVAATALRSFLIEQQSALFSPEIVSINAFVQRSVRKLPNAPVKVSDRLAAAMVRSVIDENKSQLDEKLYTLLASRSGSVALLETCNELVEHEVEPQSLLASGSPLITAVGSLYAAFLDFCRGRRVGTLPVLMRFLAERCEKQAGAPELPSEIVFSGYNATTPLLRRLIRALQSHATLTVFLPFSSGHSDLFGENKHLLQNPDGLRIEEYRPWLKGKTAALVERLFITSQPQNQKSEAAHFFSAPGRYDEVEHAATRIRRLISEGVAPESICLTMRNIADYDQFIRTVFDLLEIPYSLRRGIPMLQSAIIKTIARCLGSSSQKIRFDGLLTLVDSAFIDLPEKPALKGLICSAGVYQAYTSKWPAIVRQAEERLKDGAIEISSGSVDALADFIGDLESLADTDADFRAITSFIKKWFVLPEEDRAVHRQHLDAFMKLVEEVKSNHAYLRDRLDVESQDTPLQALNEAITEENIPPSIELRGGVTVANFFDAGYQNFQHCFVIGMDENSVPRSGGAGAGVLTDSMRETIAAQLPSGESLPLMANRWRAEAQAFLLVVAASDKLNLFYSRNDEKGKEVLPSPYLSELQALAGQPDINRLPGGDQRPMTQVAPDYYSIERQSLRRRLQKNAGEDGVSAAMYELLLQKEDRYPRMMNIMDRVDIEKRRFEFLVTSHGPNPLPADSYVGLISSNNVLESIRNEFGNEDYAWSYSTLEKSMRSPFVFMLEKLLKARDFPLPTREPDRRIMGDYAHQLLYHTILRCRDSYPQPGLETLLAALNEASRRALEEMFSVSAIDDLSLPVQLALKKAGIQVLDLLRLEAGEANRKPFVLEQLFSAEDCLVTWENESMRFQGRFDRVDELTGGEESLEIIDYKIGGPGRYTSSQADVTTGSNLQMPMYMLFASVMYEKPVEEIRGRFISLQDPAKNILFSLHGRSAKNTAPLFDENDEENALLPAMFAARRRILSGVYVPIGNFYDRERMVARWFELPPEMTGGESNA